MTTTAVETLIIGAGFGGIAAARALQQAGHEEFLVLDAQDEIGGVWRSNRYPGCASDMPGVLFGYRDQPLSPLTMAGAARTEVLDYLEHIVRTFGLGPRIRCGVKIDRIEWQQGSRDWAAFAADGSRITARFVIVATGTSGGIRWPDVPGLDAFDGKIVHTAAWPETLDFDGLDVVLIGTGASAIQVAPQLAARCRTLSILQRSPRWILPRPPELPKLVRKGLASLLGRKLAGNLLEAFVDFNARALIGGNAARLKRMDRRYRAIMQREAAGVATHASLLPSAPFGCSRTLFSNAYFETLRSPHVSLGNAPTRIAKDHVVDAAGTRHPADLIVMATGHNRFERVLPIIGPAGINLYDQWKARPEALLGVLASDMPNFIHFSGPNSGVLNSAPRTLQAQAHFATRLISETAGRGDAASFRATTAQVAEFSARLTPKLDRTIWAGDHCDSWYTSASASNPIIWPGTLAAYRRAIRNFDVKTLIEVHRPEPGAGGEFHTAA